MIRIKIHNPVLGVPITFLSYHNPVGNDEQFKLLGITKTWDKKFCPFIGGKELYNRLLIKRGEFS